ncbi:MAG: hypothetical protein ACJA0V_003441, partial [Planctomycetota bacterium]
MSQQADEGSSVVESSVVESRAVESSVVDEVLGGVLIIDFGAQYCQLIAR